jgi:hypothetical protein
MRVPYGVLAFGVALGAAALALFGPARGRSTLPDLEARIDGLAGRIEQLERVEERRAERAPSGVQVSIDEGPTLVGRGLAGSRESGETVSGAARAADAEGSLAVSPEAVQAMVEKAVTKKAAQMQRMQATKKPTIDVFAETLGLTEAERRAVEQGVLQSQREILAIIQTPAEDGTVFVDELVEVLAQGIAHPGEDPSRGQRLFGRLLSEEIPGTRETYAARVDAVKKRLRESFRQDWDGKTYAAFEAWPMDPTEIRGIPGSPWQELEERVKERARRLGADLPPPDDS